MRGVAMDVLARDERRFEEAGFTVEAHAREGDPAQTMIDVAGENSADLIAVGTHGNTGLTAVRARQRGEQAHAPRERQPADRARRLSAVDAARRAIAAELLAASRAHDAAQEDRLARYRNLEPESAELLGVLVRAAAPRTILELGTSNGYSTMWLADAAEAVGARLVSVEIDAGAERAGARAPRARGPQSGSAHRRTPAACCARPTTERGASSSSTPSGRPTRGYWPDLLRTLAPGAPAGDRQRASRTPSRSRRSPR